MDRSQFIFLSPLLCIGVRFGPGVLHIAAAVTMPARSAKACCFTGEQPAKQAKVSTEQARTAALRAHRG